MERILLVDIMFPNKYAKWRLVEIKSFIDKYDTDILVIERNDHLLSVTFGFDFAELKVSHSLDQYDILIFNPKYNWINRFNSGIDGTKYNHQCKGDYLLRKKIFRDATFNMAHYAKVYHIFLRAYLIFNKHYQFPMEKQYIHLYPGGSLVTLEDSKKIDPKAKIISAQHFITKYIETNMTNQFINIYGAPFIYRDEVIKPKSINNGNLNICFTSLGHFEKKGGHIYFRLVDSYKKKYPVNNVVFYQIGKAPSNKNIKRLDTMAQDKLDTFYYNNIDVLLNLDPNMAMNGFPLGIEATIQGVVLFTPDYHQSNENNGFDYGDELIIINVNKLDDIIGKINELYCNRDLLLEKSRKIQEKSVALFNYSNTMEKIFEFIQ